MLLSYINTGLRDRYEDLGDMASSEGFDEAEIRERLDLAGFIYDEGAKRFTSHKVNGGRHETKTSSFNGT